MGKKKEIQNGIKKVQPKLTAEKKMIKLLNKNIYSQFSLCCVTDGGKSRVKGDVGEVADGDRQQKINVRSEGLM